MPIVTDAELGRALRQNELSPVYFLYGKEVYLSQKLSTSSASTERSWT